MKKHSVRRRNRCGSFYARIDVANRPLFSRDLVGRMYRDLDAARRLTNDAGIRGRLEDLALYTRYAELLLDMDDEAAVGAALTHAYRIRNTHMVHSLALWRDTRGWPSKPEGDQAWNVPESKNPWKNSAPFSAAEMDKIIAEGIERNPLMSFAPVAYSKSLVPATPLGLKTPGRIGKFDYVRSVHHFYVWVDQANTALKLTVTGGQVGMGAKTNLELYAENDPTGAILAAAELPNDRQPHEVVLKTSFEGLHRIAVRSARAGASIRWPDGMPVSFASSVEEPITLSHRIDMYFYVPKGSKVVGGFAQGVGAVRDGDNKPIFSFNKEAFAKGNYFSIPVPPGQDGSCGSSPRARGRACS